MNNFSFEGFSGGLDTLLRMDGPGDLTPQPPLQLDRENERGESVRELEDVDQRESEDRVNKLEVLVQELANSVTQIVNVLNNKEVKPDEKGVAGARSEPGWVMKNNDKVPEFDGTKPLYFSKWRKSLIRYFNRNPWMKDSEKISVVEASLKGIAREDADKRLDKEKVSVEVFIHNLGRLYQFPNEREQHLENFKRIRFDPGRGIRLFSNDLRASFIDAYPLQDYQVSEVLKDAFIAGVPEEVAKELRKLSLDTLFEDWVEVANKAYKAMGVVGNVGMVGATRNESENSEGSGLTANWRKKSGNGQGRW